jgi:hypothetical protein
MMALVSYHPQERAQGENLIFIGAPTGIAAFVGNAE